MSNQQAIVANHVDIYRAIPEALRPVFYIHRMWSGVSCIRLVKGGYKQLMELGKQSFGTESHALILSLAETEILRTAQATRPQVWCCARRVIKGSDGVDYVGVFVFLGTSNYEDFMEDSKKRRTTQSPENPYQPDNTAPAPMEF